MIGPQWVSVFGLRRIPLLPHIDSRPYVALLRKIQLWPGRGPAGERCASVL